MKCWFVISAEEEPYMGGSSAKLECTAYPDQETANRHGEKGNGIQFEMSLRKMMEAGADPYAFLKARYSRNYPHDWKNKFYEEKRKLLK